MSNRNNEDRIGARMPDTNPPPVGDGPTNPLHFVTPTEFIEIPSKGIGYPKGHPLDGKDVIEIRYMTAKEEDILSSKTLLKKGIAIERFLENVIIDKNIKVNSLLIGDKNAIIIGARSSGYGNIYETKVTCPKCETENTLNFDLNSASMYTPPENLEDMLVKKTESGNFLIKAPTSEFDIEVRLMRGQDEVDIVYNNQKKKKYNLKDSLVTDQYKRFIVSVNGYTDPKIINYYIDNMPAADSRHIRRTYKKVTPNVELKDQFCCLSCGYEQELEVPLGADFFWPDR